MQFAEWVRAKETATAHNIALEDARNTAWTAGYAAAKREYEAQISAILRCDTEVPTFYIREAEQNLWLEKSKNGSIISL